VRDLGMPLISVVQVQLDETHPYRSNKEMKMNTHRKNALGAGILFVIADIAGFSSIPFLGFLSNPDYLIKVAENRNQLVTGGLLILTMELACSGIAIWLYPVLKKQNEALALWAVGLRMIEVICGIVSAIGLLALIPLSQEFLKAGTPDASFFQTLGAVIQTTRAWTRDVFMLFAWGLGALLYNYIFFQAKLLPRWLSGWGIVAILLHLASCLLTIFDIIGPSSPMQVFLLAPSALQEIVLAIWLIVKGFDPRFRGKAGERRVMACAQEDLALRAQHFNRPPGQQTRIARSEADDSHTWRHSHLLGMTTGQGSPLPRPDDR